MGRPRQSGMKLKEGGVNHPSFQVSMQFTPISPDPSGYAVLSKNLGHEYQQAIVLNQLETLIANNQELALHIAGEVHNLLEGYMTTGFLHRSNKPVVSLEAGLPTTPKAKQTLTLDHLVAPEQSIEVSKEDYPVLLYNLPAELDACEIGQHVKRACKEPVVISQVQCVASGQAIIHFKTWGEAQSCLALDGKIFSGHPGMWCLRAQTYGAAIDFESCDEHQSYPTALTNELYSAEATYVHDAWQTTSRQPLELVSETSRPDVQLEKMLIDEVDPEPNRDPMTLLQTLLSEGNDSMAAKALQTQLGCEDQESNDGIDATVSENFNVMAHQKSRTQWRPKFPLM